MIRHIHGDREYRWVLLCLLVMSFTTTILSRNIWGTLLSVASDEMNMTMTQAGGWMSAFYIGYLSTQILGGWIADRFEVKYLLACSIFSVGITTFLMSMPFVTKYFVGYVIRFISGLFSGVVLPFCSRLLFTYFKHGERGIAMGILFTSPSIGGLMVNLYGPRILVASSWRDAFRVTAVIILVICILDLLFVREPKKSKEEVESTNKINIYDGLKNFFSNKQVILLSIIGFLYVALPSGYITWAHKFMTDAFPAGANLTQILAGMIITVFSAMGIIGSIASGIIVTKLHINRKYFIMIVYLIMAISVVLFGMQKNIVGLLTTSIILGLVSQASTPHITTWAVNISGDKYAATTTSVQNMIFHIANVIFPVVIGDIIDRTKVNGIITDYRDVWNFFGVLSVMALIVTTFTNKDSAKNSA